MQIVTEENKTDLWKSKRESDSNLEKDNDNKLHKKPSSPLTIFSVNVTKSAVSCGFGHIYWRNP